MRLRDLTDADDHGGLLECDETDDGRWLDVSHATDISEELMSSSRLSSNLLDGEDGNNLVIVMASVRM